MAGLTKEQRAEREKAKEAELIARIQAEVEKRIRAEYEEKFNSSNNDTTVEVEKTKPEPKTTRAIKIPLDIVVPVICNVVNGAFYSSKRSLGYIVEWEDIGSVEYMELSELVSMRNTDKRFFEDNWIILDDTDDYTATQIYDFLKVSKYYEHYFTPETIDDIFSYSKDKIIKTVSTLSKGMKESIAARAKKKLDEGTLDKNIIDTLEAALDIQFSI